MKEQSKKSNTDGLCTYLLIYNLYAYKMFFSDPPGVPEITGYAGEPVKKGDRVSLTCRSRGGNPPATLTWWKDGEKIDSSYTNVEGGSTNTYEFLAEVTILFFNLFL